MLIYKGDKFVKGKKFTINENVYVFSKKDNKDRYIFESIKGKEIVKLSESEARKAQTYIMGLCENANQDNNEIIEKPYYVEIWETEEDRDMGEGFIHDYFATREEVIEEVERLWNGINDYAAVEACYEDENGDSYTICCGADGEMTYYDEDLKANN